MTAADFLILAAVGIALFFALRSVRRNQHHGCCGGCSGNCESCCGCSGKNAKKGDRT